MAGTYLSGSSQQAYIEGMSTTVASNAHTLSCWLLREYADAGSGPSAAILAISDEGPGSTGPNYSGFGIQLNWNSTIGGIWWRNGTGTSVWGSTVLSDTTWAHVVVRGNTSTAHYTFVNGSQEGSDTSTSIDMSTETLDNVIVNGYPRWWGVTTDFSVCELCIWDTNLSDDEITQLYCNGVPMFGLPMSIQPANIIGYWPHVDANAGTTFGRVQDLGPQAATMTSGTMPTGIAMPQLASIGNMPIVTLAAAGEPPAGDAMPEAFSLAMRRRAG